MCGLVVQPQPLSTGMWSAIIKFLTEITTTRAGDFCVTRVGMIGCGLALIVLSGWSVIHDHEYSDALAFGSGAAAICADGGFGIGGKAKDANDTA